MAKDIPNQFAYKIFTTERRF